MTGSFTFITKTPPAAVLLREGGRSAKGSGVPNRDKAREGHQNPGA